LISGIMFISTSARQQVLKFVNKENYYEMDNTISNRYAFWFRSYNVRNEPLIFS